ncbi:MAG TPA: LysR family transcriptional regulator [Beijerinckiaceae bacterium]|nr:LysR family transcriptional regulator [Beijerinckiaceae bacterium]
MISTRQLRYFVETAQAGSFVAAARVLHMSQPALSLQIRQLEAALKTRLINRSGRQIALTPAGETFLVTARQALAAIAAAEASVIPFRDSPAPPLRLGLVPTIGRAIISELLEQSRARGLNLALREGVSSELLAALRRGEVDAAFSYDPPADKAYDDVSLVREFPVLVCRRALLPDVADTMPVARLAGLPLLLGGPQNASRRAIQRHAEQHNIPLELRYEIEATSLHREILLAEDVFAFVPRGHFLPEIDSGLFRAIAIEPPAEQILTLSTRRQIDPAARLKLLDIICLAITHALAGGRQGWLQYEETRQEP